MKGKLRTDEKREREEIEIDYFGLKELDYNDSPTGNASPLFYLIVLIRQGLLAIDFFSFFSLPHGS